MAELSRSMQSRGHTAPSKERRTIMGRRHREPGKLHAAS